MTNLAQMPAIPVHLPSVSWPRIPRMGLGAMYSALSGLLGESYAMAYVDPMLSSQSDPRHRFGGEPDIGS